MRCSLTGLFSRLSRPNYLTLSPWEMLSPAVLMKSNTTHAHYQPSKHRTESLHSPERCPGAVPRSGRCGPGAPFPRGGPAPPRRVTWHWRHGLCGPMAARACAGAGRRGALRAAPAPVGSGGGGGGGGSGSRSRSPAQVAAPGAAPRLRSAAGWSAARRRWSARAGSERRAACGPARPCRCRWRSSCTTSAPATRRSSSSAGAGGRPGAVGGWRGWSAPCGGAWRRGEGAGERGPRPAPTPLPRSAQHHVWQRPGPGRGDPVHGAGRVLLPGNDRQPAPLQPPRPPQGESSPAPTSGSPQAGSADPPRPLWGCRGLAWATRARGAGQAQGPAVHLRSPGSAGPQRFHAVLLWPYSKNSPGPAPLTARVLPSSLPGADHRRRRWGSAARGGQTPDRGVRGAVRDRWGALGSRLRAGTAGLGAGGQSQPGFTASTGAALSPAVSRQHRAPLLLLLLAWQWQRHLFALQVIYVAAGCLFHVISFTHTRLRPFQTDVGQARDLEECPGFVEVLLFLLQTEFSWLLAEEDRCFVELSLATKFRK